MEKMNNKKHRWLLPVVALVLVAAAVAVALALSFGGGEEAAQTQTQPTEPHQTGVELYWNVDGPDYQANTLRPKTEDGTYFVTFASGGESHRFEVTEEVYQNGIDMYEVVSLVFDENGMVVDFKTVPECTGGFFVHKFYVESIEGNTVTCNSSAIFRGYQKTFTLSEDTQVYMVAGNNILTGMPTKLQINDEVIAIQDHDGKITHVYTKTLETYDNIYWNVARKYDSNLKMTTRELDVTGGYVFEFVHNGELITLKARDRDMASQIDAVAGRILMLDVDEEGFVTGCLEAGQKCSYFGSWYRISNLNEASVTATRTNSSSNFLRTVTAVKASNFVAYDVSGQNGVPIGTPTELRIGDEITSIANERGQVFYVIVLQRIEESKMYWNVERQYDSATQSTKRTPDADGWYHILLAVDGQQVTYKTKDVALVNAIDAQADSHFGLKLDGDVITAFYAPSRVYGGNVFGSWYDVTAISEDGNVTVERLLSGTNKGNTYTAKMASDCKVYNTTSLAGFVGEETTLQVGDRICAELKYDGTIQIIYVVNRLVDSPIYWNVERKWDSTNSVSTRKPSADGYYYIKLATNGKQVTYKTYDKSIVNQIDGKADKHFGLITSGDVILKYLPIGQVTGGGVFGSWYDVTGINGNQLEATRLITGSNYGKVVTGTMIKNCPIYDVTAAADMVGQKTTLRYGDRICGVTNARGEIVTIFVVGNRFVNGTQLYWNVERKWDSANSVSTRKPDAEGYYSFLLACDGKQVTLKTKDAEIVQSIDAKADKYFNLKVDKDGNITKYYAPSAAYGGGVFGSWYNVTDITNGVVTVERTIGGSNQGTVDSAPMPKDCPVYNVTDATFDSHVGEVTELMVGDLICGHKDKNGKLVVVYVVGRNDIPGEPDHFHCACVDGSASGVGSHTCDETTGWSAWDKPNRLPTSGNWYLTVDVDLSEVTAAYSVGVDSQLRLCLNGHKITGPKTVTIWWVQNYMAITDCIGTGSIVTQSTALGGLAHVFCKAETHNGIAGEFELFAGNILATETSGGTAFIYVGNNTGFDIPAIFNMYGGTITGGNATGDCGAVRVLTANALFNMYGGTITDCHSAKSGGAIYVDKNATFHMAGGTISNCTAVSSGGAVYAGSASAVKLTGGTITGCTATGNGGGINLESNAELTLSGGTITGCQGLRGGALYVKGTVHMYDGATLTQNSSVDNEGGNVNINASGAMYMHHGNVTKGSTNKKGGNFQVHGILEISGGTISDGTAAGYGGNISTYSNSVVTITGGTISGGTLHFDKARDDVLCTLNISGGTVNAPITLAHCGATVSGGTLSAGLAVDGASTVNLEGNPVIAGCETGNLKISDGSLVTVGAFTEGAEIWVGLADLTDTFGTLADAAHLIYFHSDLDNYEVALDEQGRLYLKSTLAPHIHCVCGGSAVGIHDSHSCRDIQWQPLSAATTDFGSLQSGSYYLLEDVQITSLKEIKDKTLSICLNGHKVTTTAERVFGILEADGIVNICDCSGRQTDGQWSWDGQITGGKASYGGVFWTDDGSELNIYGGNITGLAGHQVIRGGIFYITGRLPDNKYSGISTLNLYNGKIYGGYASRGGNIEANSACIVNIYGGTVTGGKVQYMEGQANGQGGNIHMSASSVLNMYGGKITDGVCTVNGVTTHRGSGGNVTFEGVFNMYGGEISGGKCQTNTTAKKSTGSDKYDAYSCQYSGMGGNLALFWAKSQFNMYGGEIFGGEVNGLYGGNILVRNATAQVNISGGSIWGGIVNADGDTGNSAAMVLAADAAGGSIAVTQGILNISGGTFGIDRDGQAVGGQAGVGGTVYVASGTTATITGGTFANGTATEFGGNFYNQGTLSITGATVTGGITTNAANTNARGGNISNTATLSVTNCTISGGKAWHGGNIHQNGGTLTMTGTTLTGGQANLNLDDKGNGTGGNLFCAAGTTTITNCQITDGTAYNGGNMGLQAKATVSGTTVSGGTASTTGGNIFFYTGGNLTLNGDSIVSDGTAFNGGNVGMAGQNVVMNCTDVTFEGGSANTSTGYGGSIYAATGTTSLTNVTVTGGNAKYGGALAVGGSGICSVTGSTVGTSTGGTGRAAYIAKGGNLTVQDSTMNNTVEASNGTCIWNCGTLILVGTVNLNKDVFVSTSGVDIMVDARSSSGAVMDISGLTAVNEPIILRRWETDSNDYAGLLANGATQEQLAMFMAWNKDFYVTYADGCLYLNNAAVKGMNAKGNAVQGFASLEAALAADDADITWYMLLADQEGVTVSEDLIIDLNGFDLSSLTLAEGVTLTGMDTTTDKYDITDGFGLLTLSEESKGTVATLVKTEKAQIGAIKRYMAITTADGISFHRFYLGITHISLKPSVTGVGYKAAFYGDELVQGQVKSYGYNLWLNGGNKMTASKNSAFESGKTLTLRLRDFDVEGYGTADVNAEVFLELQDGSVITSSTYSYTLKGLLESVAQDVSGLSAEQMSALQTMCRNNADAMADWKIDSILNWTAPEEN